MQNATRSCYRSLASLMRGKKGSALLITLAFVFLLTVLIVGFLSRTLTEQRISSSSANQVRADLLAQGVEANLIGALEQEIQSTSNSKTVSTSGGNIYIPSAPANMVPLYDYPSSPTGTTPPKATLANLLKISTNTPAAGSTFPTATTALTSAASLNFRSVTSTIWMEPDLVDPTAVLPTPNWIVVARDGSNPTTFSNSGANEVTYDPANKTGTKTIVGRYAYMIYDEGGLLDMNVAGSPTTVANGTAIPRTVSDQASYRYSEGTADLTQLTKPGTPPVALFTNAQIDTLIGWRNNASVSPPAPTGTTSVPSNLTAANAANYFSYVLGNMNGFLNTGNPAVIKNGTIYSTDQAFTSRSELVQFMQSLLGTTNAPIALQYMTHFSRGLSQPSYIPPVNNPNVNGAPTTTTYNPASSPGNGSNTANGKDATINPSFLTVRVSNAFIRNDGSVANAGDPLVKKRFNLNRLAWLTYEGPLCDGHLTSGVAASAADITSNADLQVIANALHTTYGLSWSFLQQGTAANIYNYFGLSWVIDTRTFPQGDNQYKWFYNHGNTNIAGPFTALPGLPGSGGVILSLSNVAAANREPDFAELLLAGISAGSKAKTATLAAGNKTPAPASISITGPFPDNVQNQLDTSLPFAIIQVFANVIDQYDLDGYPTRIIYSDGVLPAAKEFYGIENLPYFYRSRGACLEQVPIGAGTIEGVTAAQFPGGKGKITSPGVYSFLQLPEIWNPHDQNSPRCALTSTGAFLTDSKGNPMFPTSFRLVADSTDPDDVTTNQSNIATNYYLVGGIASDAKNPESGPGYSGTVKMNTSAAYAAPSTSPWPPGSTGLQQMQYTVLKPFPICAESSALTFNIPATAAGNGFFREPTLLLKPNVPAGSNLAAGGANNILNASNATTVCLPGGLNATYPAPLDLLGNGMIKSGSGGLISQDDNGTYLGIYLGTGPGAWYCDTPATPATGSWPPTPTPSPAPTKYQYADVINGWDTRVYNNLGAFTGKDFPIASANVLTYRMQYSNTYDANNPGWSSYDCKYGISGSRGSLTAPASPAAYPAVGQNPPTTTLLNSTSYTVCTDPRTSRFALLHATNMNPPGYNKLLNTAFGWLDVSGFVVLTSARPDLSNGFWVSAYDASGGNNAADGAPEAYGWISTATESNYVAPMGLTAQNDPHFSPNGGVATTGIPGGTTVPISDLVGATGGKTPQYYADPDGVVRRGTAAYYSGGAGSPGQPLAVANTSVNGIETAIVQAGNTSPTQSRPIILNRPFKSVAELGYVFSGTPWKNLDFFTPESGDAALLDLFTLNDTTDASGLVAGKVNLNTQQIPVLQAVVSGAYKDEQNNYASPPGVAVTAMTSSEAKAIATALAARTLSTNTTAGQGPLQNVSELVGKYVKTTNIGGALIDGSQSFAGFSSDAINNPPNDLTTAFTAAGSGSNTVGIQRMRESAIRALSSSGQTRVWNLMIDVVAQTGRYPKTATSFDQFTVEGEQHYWIHLAIDRLTGVVVDKQVEVVKE